MTSAEFCACLKQLGWSQRVLADRLGVDKMVANKWANGVKPIPEPVARWLTELRTAHAKVPEPVDWVRGSR